MADNPLSEEQVAQLNEIAKLPAEEQKTKLNAFLQTLTPEQMEFLKQQQAQQANPFQLIVEGKIPSKKIYEDNAVMAILDIKPATKGHVIVFPKKHYSVMGQMPDNEVAHLFTVAHNIAKLLFETLKAEGTNVFVANGAVAGQTVDHVLVHVIPRFKDDGLNFVWQPKELSEEELNTVHQQLHSKLAQMQPAAAQPAQAQPEPVVAEEQAHEETRMAEF